MPRFSGRQATHVIANATHSAKNMTHEGNQKLDELKLTLSNDFSSGTLVSGITLSSGNIRGETIDLGASAKYTQVLIFGKCNMGNTSHGFQVMTSNVNTSGTFIRLNAIGPTLNPIDNMYHFAGHIIGARYLRIANEQANADLTNFTCHFVKLK